MPPPKRIAIVQSSYIPWKGYFDLMRSFDEFVLLDDVQYTRRDWRSRNRIKAKDGPLWLSIPVEVRGKYLQRIRDTTIKDTTWAQRHWRSIVASYARSKYFGEYRARFEAVYQRVAAETHLSWVNHAFLKEICTVVGITTPISWSTDYEAVGGKSERLIAICRQAGATEYVSGPSARNYIVPGVFERAGITLKFVDYSSYPEYPQLYPPFEHGVSVLDLIFSTGPETERYLLSF